MRPFSCKNSPTAYSSIQFLFCHILLSLSSQRNPELRAQIHVQLGLMIFFWWKRTGELVLKCAVLNISLLLWRYSHLFPCI
jgi:hypothetical protein